jgi:hypothetical protein
VPDLPVPEQPPAQTALRAVVEAVLRDFQATASYRHDDRFWTSDNGREAVYGWGTTIKARAAGKPVEVWFDGLDNDIAVWQDGDGRRPRSRPVRHEWRDLTDLHGVFEDVANVLRSLLRDNQ